MLKSLKWEDWLGVVLGVWLLLSPWTFGYVEASVATTNALALGLTLIFVEQLNLDRHEDVEEWLDIAAGAWLVVSPFVLGFVQVRAAAVNAVVVGALTILLAAWALSPLDSRMASWWSGRIAHR